MSVKRSLNALKRRLLGRDLAVLFDVSTSTIYHWSKRLPAAREAEIQALWDQVKVESPRPPKTLKQKRKASAAISEKILAGRASTGELIQLPGWQLISSGDPIRGRAETKSVYRWSGDPILVNERGLPRALSAIYLQASRPDGQAPRFSAMAADFSSALAFLLNGDDAYPFNIAESDELLAVVYV